MRPSRQCIDAIIWRGRFEADNLSGARVWALLCSRAGANNQALALAEALGLPFEAKRLEHSRLGKIGHRLGATRLTLDPRHDVGLGPPWPELVIAVSRANVPVARWIKGRSGARTKIVFLGNPRIGAGAFDAVITTPDHLHPRGDNVLVLPLPVAATLKGEPAAPPIWAVECPAPRLLLLIGAPVRHWDLSEAMLAEAVGELARRANARGGTVIVSGSPRTPERLVEAAGRALAKARTAYLAPARTGGIAPLLAIADEIHVTGDSMAMVTEAILTGKPVGIVPLLLTPEGCRNLGSVAAGEGARSRGRDLRRFWGGLWSKGLVGTIDEPRKGRIEPPAETAATFIRSVSGHDQLTGYSALDPPGQVPHGKAR